MQGIKYENENFNQEVTYQNKLLDKLDNDIDRTHQKMIKVDTKLKNLIALSSTCCIWIIIILELAIELCIIIFI